MIELSSALIDNYQYEYDTFSPSTFKEEGGLSELDVFNAHYILSDYFLEAGEEVRFGILNYNMLASAVGRQYVEFEGHKKWSDCFHKTATLTYGLTLDHAFHDGNKRTALLSLLLCMNNAKRELVVSKELLEKMMVQIASRGLYQYSDFKKFANNDDPEVEFIASKLRSWTRKRNERLYTITYSELNGLLRPHNVWLDNPSGNRINIMQKKERRLLFSKQIEDIRVGTIGFPGWKKQVSNQDLRHLLQSTGLTAEHGIDSDVFFNGATPTYELLREYHKPLQRLKDK